MLTSMITKSLTAATEELVDTTSISLVPSLLPLLPFSSFFSLTFSFFLAEGDLPFLTKKATTFF
jgi:hypothetical protein